MKFRDICKKYGFKFVFKSDALFQPYMITQENILYNCIVDLKNGKSAMFADDDRFLEEEVMPIHCEMERIL